MRNPNYWGTQGIADEVVIQFFKSGDTMVQALKAGEIDYAHGANADQFNALQTEPNIQTVVGAANGWTQLALQHLRDRHGQDDQGRRPIDPGAARPGLPRRAGYAVDHDALVDGSSAATAIPGRPSFRRS